jgi:hypothetical protein
LNLNCSPELLARVKAKARLEGVTVTELVILLLEGVLDGDGAELPVGERLRVIESRLSRLEAACREDAA